MHRAVPGHVGVADVWVYTSSAAEDEDFLAAGREKWVRSA